MEPSLVGGRGHVESTSSSGEGRGRFGDAPSLDGETIDHICAGPARWMCGIGGGHLAEGGEGPPTDCPQCDGQGRYDTGARCGGCGGTGFATELGGSG
jgi:hypothetical protein